MVCLFQPRFACNLSGQELSPTHESPRSATADHDYYGKPGVAGNGQQIQRSDILRSSPASSQFARTDLFNEIAGFNIWPKPCLILAEMDIARPQFKRQMRRRQLIWGAVGLVCLGAVTIGVSRLKSAAPEVERSTVWTDTVKRGPMLRQDRK